MGDLHGGMAQREDAVALTLLPPRCCHGAPAAVCVGGPSAPCPHPPPPRPRRSPPANGGPRTPRGGAGRCADVGRGGARGCPTASRPTRRLRARAPVRAPLFHPLIHHSPVWSWRQGGRRPLRPSRLCRPQFHLPSGGGRKSPPHPRPPPHPLPRPFHWGSLTMPRPFPSAPAGGAPPTPAPDAATPLPLGYPPPHTATFSALSRPWRRGYKVGGGGGGGGKEDRTPTRSSHDSVSQPPLPLPHAAPARRRRGGLGRWQGGASRTERGRRSTPDFVRPNLPPHPPPPARTWQRRPPPWPVCQA